MATKQYKLKGRRVKGALYLAYSEGFLVGLHSTLGTLNQSQLDWLANRPIWQEQGLSALTDGFVIVELKPKTVQDKRIFWNQAYKAKYGVNYRGKQTDNALLKVVEISTELLDFYFGHMEYPLSADKRIPDYCKHFDHVKREVHGKQPEARQAWPQEWSEDYNRRLSPSESVAYQASLVDSGVYEMMFVGGRKVPVKKVTN